MAKNIKDKSSENESVSFRLDAEFRELLERESLKSGQPKPNLYARLLVQRGLTNSGPAELQQEFDGLKRQLRKIREDLATVALVLLVKAAKEDPAKVEEWVRKNLAP